MSYMKPLKKMVLNTVGRVLYWTLWPFLGVYFSFRRSARVVMICEGQLLLVKSWFGRGHWSLPGGGRHYRESSEQAALRELKEETGVVVAVRDLRYLCDGEYRNFIFKSKYDLFVVVRSRRPRARLASEITDLMWTPFADIDRTQVSDDVLVALEQLQRVTQEAANRRHERLKTARV